jgi:hypothetical protein
MDYLYNTRRLAGYPQLTAKVTGRIRLRRGRVDAAALSALQGAVQDARPVTGLTHLFYRYPARFSPTFARLAIEAFTDPGDLVVDPFMGGGTTLVEARVLGRPAVGADISHLARFVAQVKVTPLSDAEVSAVKRWAEDVVSALNIHSSLYIDAWPEHLGGKKSWRVGKLIGQALREVERLRTAKSRAFARCLILRTGQWALDGRERIPTVAEFRAELLRNLNRMVSGILEFGRAAAAANADATGGGAPWTTCLVVPAADLPKHRVWRRLPKPKLILTSPPYAGVHVVYGRWQILGRRETPAPFWIANSRDGHGPAHYTFGDRHSERGYFNHARLAFQGIARIAGSDTTLLQLVGFARPEEQLPAYLKVLKDTGFEEVDLGVPDRLWRQVPNRKWHADFVGETAGSREVVLVHRLAR